MLTTLSRSDSRSSLCPVARELLVVRQAIVVAQVEAENLLGRGDGLGLLGRLGGLGLLGRTMQVERAYQQNGQGDGEQWCFLHRSLPQAKSGAFLSESIMRLINGGVARQDAAVKNLMHCGWRR